MDHVHPQRARFVATIAVFVALFAAVGARLHRLQVEEGSRLAELGDRQRERAWVIPAARGAIVDASGAPLAESVATWTLFADPLWMTDRLRATVDLSRTLGLDRAQLRAHFESQRNGRLLARGLDDRQAEAVKQLKLEGVYLRRDFTRIYREGALAAHVLGFVNAEGGGGAGLELEFEKQLAGVAGRETLTLNPRDGQGPRAERVAPKPGASLQLTIDLPLQRVVERELAVAIEKHAPKNAAAVVIDPVSGEIKALASWPTFSPVDRAGLDPNSMRNNVIGFVYEPGSTMKPLVVGAAVAEGLARWTEQIFCERGRWTFRDGRSARTISDHSVKHGGHGNLTLTEGIALSDNILMAKLGIRLGPERLWHWERLFGFGRPTGICLPGEDAGIMLHRSKWTLLGSCMSVPMGHEIAVTPLQLVMAHAAIANGGVWQAPRLVRRVYTVDERGSAVELPREALPEPRRVFAPEDALRIQEAMTHTMTDGTAKGAQLEGYTSAGKTGTAEKLIDGRYAKDRHVGSFVCWAPAERGVKPELLCLVVIDDPSRGGHYGGETAAPVVQRILQQGLEARGIPKRVDPEAVPPGRAAAVPAAAPAPRPAAAPATRRAAPAVRSGQVGVAPAARGRTAITTRPR